MATSSKCINVPLTQTVYKETVASGYVVLFFFLCFFLALVLVILFAKYVAAKLKAERIREKESQKRKTMRIIATSHANGTIFDESDSESQGSLATNYVGQVGMFHNKIRPVDESGDVMNTRERSQSGISFVLLDGISELQNARLPNKDLSVVEILGTLFTSAKNALPPTVVDQCLYPLIDSFELLFGFNQEAFISILDLMLTSLLEKRRISESENLAMMTKYDQLLYEKMPADASDKYTSKMHFVISNLKSEILNCKNYSSEDEGKKMAAIPRDIAKFMCMFQKEMIGGNHNRDAFDAFVVREYGLVSCLIDRWLSLELIRYRLSIIYDATNSTLKKNKIGLDASNKVLNDYLKNVYDTMNKYCKEYEDDLYSYTDHTKRENSRNLKQCKMELDVQRTEQRCRRINDLESFSKKSITSFFISQNDVFVENYKEFIQNILVVDSNSIKQFSDYQKANEKKLTRSLKACEEDLFTSCQQQNFISEEDLIYLSKTMTTSLKDFRSAHQELKKDLLTSFEKNITRISNTLQRVYGILDQKFLHDMEDLREHCLDTLHALSNLKDEEMDDIESEFEIAFWSINFNSYYTVMSEIITKIHAHMDVSMKNVLVKDVSFSLDDMVQILKQDKSVLSHSSLFSTPDPSFYLKIENDLLKSTGSLAILIEEYMDVISRKLFKFVFMQCSDVIHTVNNWQSNAYYLNVCASKEGIRKCNTDSRGYTSRLGSSLVKSFNLKLAEIWRSQSDFKSLKIRENFKSTMKDYAFNCPKYFKENQNQATAKSAEESLEFFEEISDLEYSAYFSFEKHNKSNAVKLVLDSNLENELMIRKMGEKIDALNATVAEGSNNAVSDRDGLRKEKLKKRMPTSANSSKKSKMNALLASPKPKSKALKRTSIQVH